MAETTIQGIASFRANQDSTGVITPIVFNRAEAALHDGRAFVISTVITNVATNGSVSVVLKGATDRTAHVTFEASGEYTGKVDVIKGGTSGYTTASALTVVNMNMNSTATAGTLAYAQITHNSQTTLSSEYLPTLGQPVPVERLYGCPQWILPAKGVIEAKVSNAAATTGAFGVVAFVVEYTA